jgi:hypothetical protein
MPAIIFDKRKVSSLNIDFSDVRFRMDQSWQGPFYSSSRVEASSAPLTSQSTVSTRIHRLEDHWLHTLCPQQGWHNVHVCRSTISMTL